MKRNLMQKVVVAYIVIAVLTYGYAFNHIAIRVEENAKIERVSGAFLCAIFAPLYWSVVLFEEKKK